MGGGLTAEEEKDRQLKAKKAFEYFKETKIEEKKFDTYRQEREQLNYFWIVEKKRLEDKKAELRNKERELQDLKADRRALRLQKQENELAHDAFLNSLKATH